MSGALNTKIPSTVQITDVTARDGFQNLKTIIPTHTKLHVLDTLIASGVRSLEVTSFVSPKAVPQMFDAVDVVTHMRTNHPDIVAVALVPNHKGASRAVDHGVKNISYVMSASVGHNKANINRTHEESLTDLENIMRSFPSLNVTLSLSTVFGCPFDGEVPIPVLINLIGRVKQFGIINITLCDTIGVAHPLQVQTVLLAIQKHHKELVLNVHFHDTHGMALANVFAALQLGINRIETTAGGLGGCPFAPGAAGNISTEDCLNMFWRMGIQTGIDFEKYKQAVKLVESVTHEPLSSHMAHAKSYRELSFFGIYPSPLGAYSKL